MDLVLGVYIVLVKLVPCSAKPQELTPQPGRSPWVLVGHVGYSNHCLFPGLKYDHTPSVFIAINTPILISLFS